MERRPAARAVGSNDSSRHIRPFKKELKYAGGAAASNTDPWYSASWVFLIDVNGDGWRDFAIFLDGNSGGPSNSIDDIRVIYANNKTTQSIDPSSTAGVHELTRIKTAQTYSSGAYAGELEQFDGNANVITTNVWPNGKYTTWYDFGTTRTIDSTASGAGWFIDFQVPLSALDASAYGGPTVTASTPLSFVFTTANSNTNPFQKDAALQGSSTITLTSTTPMPGGDLTSFNGTVISAPIIQSIAATTCPNVTLTADVLARSEVSGGSVVSSVQSVNFYYWYDSNGDGVANDAGSSWTLIGGGTQGPLGTWKKNWTTSSLAQGVYLIKAVATDDASNSTDSYTQNYSGYGSTIAYMNNNCGTSPPYMTKTVTPSSVQASGTTAQRTVTYTITITNPGSAGDSVSSITDYLPTGFSYQANAAGGSMTPTTSPTNGATGTIKWTFSPSKVVAAGGSDSLKFTVLAGTATGTYTNTASAAGSTSIDSVTNTAPVVVSDTSLSLTKTISPTGLLLPGDSFTYTIAYTNTGNVALSNVVLVDTLVAGINFVSATNSGSYSNNKVTWNLGSLSPGASGSVSVSGTVSNPFSGSSPLNDRAKATATELSSPAYSNTVSSTIASPVLTINLSASPTNLSPGDVVTYTMTYGNTGTASATNDTITTTLPSKLTYISGSASTTPTSASGQVLKWGFSSIASGSVNNTITFQATVGSYASAVQSDPITDTAFISSSQTSSAQSSASVYVTAVPNVTITKTADSSAYNGTTAKFKLTLTNYGNAAATITSLVDSLPSGFTYVSGSSQGMATANPTGTTGRIVWSTLVRTSLAVGATDTLVFQATISSTAGTYTNTGRAKGTLTTAGTSDSVTSTVSIVKNATTGAVRYKTVDKASAYVGDTLTYTIYFQNNTGGNQNNLNIIDTLVSGLTYLSYTGSGSASGGVRSFTNSPSNVLNWKIGNPFRAGQDYTLIVKIGINSNVTNGTVLTNYAHVVGTFDSTTTTVSTTALVPPRISITKEVSQTSAAPNTILTYTIVYRDSSGAGSSTNTQIIDTLLSNKLVYVVGSANKGGAYSSVSGNGGRLAWNLGTIAGGTTDSVSFEAKDTASSGSVSNVAWMKDNEGKKVSSSVSTTTAAYPVLSLSKSVDKTLAGPSDTLTYTLTLNNSGTGSASSVVLNDATPSNTTFISASPAATSAPSVGGTGTVSWNIGAFAVGSSSYTIKVKINSPLASGSVSSITNSASLTSTQVPSLTSNIVTTTVNYPSLLINKTVDKV
ncbi:MAG: DUF11 domain-containing protein, partial [Bacteroidota bacterium]|nr:DUF11 domain-containing protein [Bacteroidota bacterium]